MQAFSALQVFSNVCANVHSFKHKHLNFEWSQVQIYYYFI